MLANIVALTERLEKIELASVNVGLAQELADLMSELELSLADISKTNDTLKILHASGVTISFNLSKELDDALHSVRSVSQKFASDPKPSTLKAGSRWTSLIKKLTSFSDDYRGRLMVSWQEYIDTNLFGGLPPKQKENLLAPTDVNLKAIEIYSRLWEEFVALRKILPSDADQIVKLRDISKRLEGIEFQENVPDDVRIFLQASRTGAPLSLVTEGVQDWLSEYGLIDNFTVRARHN